MLSIIIPTYNEEKVIADRLRGLTEALTLPFELIVSDGGSTDRTVKLARPYATKIVLDTALERPTISRTRNQGAKAAGRSEFYIFLDADCVIPDPDRFFTRALGRFSADPRLVGLGCRVRVFRGEETAGDRIVFGLSNMALRFSNNVLQRGHAWGKFQMIRREAFDRLGGFREDLVTIEDADMFRRLSRIGRTRIDPLLTVFHSGRRAHQVGWPRLIIMWLVNSFFVSVSGRSFTKEWKAIR